MPLLVLARIVLEAGHLLQANWRRCVALAAAPVAVSLVFELAGEFGSSDTGIPTAADVGIAVGARLLSTLALVPFMVAWHRFTFDEVAVTLQLGGREARYGVCLVVVGFGSAAIGYLLIQLTGVLIQVTGAVTPWVYVISMLPRAVAVLLFAWVAFVLVETALGRGRDFWPAVHATKGLRGHLFLLIVAMTIVEFVVGFPIELTIAVLLDYDVIAEILASVIGTVVHVAVLAVLVSAFTLVWHEAGNADDDI